MEPLRARNKLGAVLFQFPPRFVKRRTNIEHILLCARMLEGYTLATEFRNNTWFNDKHAADTIGFERENGFVHVAVDEPQGTAFSIPSIWEATNPNLAMVRFHGRNAETWQARGLSSAAERFNYLYSDEELEELARQVQRLQEQAEETHVLFNNCYSDFGVRNAVDLQRLLQRPNQDSDRHTD